MNCNTCNGWGRIFIEQGFPNKTIPCPKCNETGRKEGKISRDPDTKKCDACGDLVLIFNPANVNKPFICDSCLSKKSTITNLDNAYQVIIDSLVDDPYERVFKFDKTAATADPPVKPKQKQNYVDEFLTLKCCGDVLNVCNPIGKNARKEITETMALIKHVKRLALSHPGKYNVLDLCAGNALTSVLAVHLLPIDYAVAIDKRPRERQWNRVKRFLYRNADIYDTKNRLNEHPFYINEDTIIVSSHPCSNLARRIVEIYKNSKAKALFILPCCYGKINRQYPQWFYTKLGKDWVWCWDLAQDIGAKLSKDERCLSPRNILLSHIREN